MVKKKKTRVTKKSTIKKKLPAKFAKATKKFQKKKLGAIGRKKPKVDPQWDLERDGITYSMISQFLGCRHRFHIGTVQGWKPRKINFAIEFGNVFHLMDEALDKGVDLDLMPKLATNYVNIRYQNGATPDEMLEVSMMAAVCAVTFKQYHLFWEKNHSLELNHKRYYNKDFHWVEKEKPFSVPYRMPNGRVVTLRGKRDGVFQLKRGVSGNWLFETKTKGKLDLEGLTAGLHKDMQTGLYLLSLGLEYKDVSPGLLYNVIRRTQLTPRSGRGKLKAGLETPASFAQRVELDIIERPEFYFHRWSRPILQSEIDEFCQRQLDPILFQICTWWDSIKKNPMSPFETECDVCRGGEVGTQFGPRDNETGCAVCYGKGVISNPHHYERPFGVYDSMAENGRGDFFEIVTNDNYFLYEQKEHTFPELQDDPIDQYLVGVKRK